jgi:hypothetical protein
MMSVHVARAVGEDEDVAALVGRHVRGLGHERAQDGHELRRAHVLHLHDLRDQLLGLVVDALGQVDVRHLPRIRVGQDLDDAAGFHGHEVVHREQREEGLVERSG